MNNSYNRFGKKFYSSRQWRKCREQFLVSKHHLCELCLSEGKITPADDVHHKNHLTPYNIDDPNVSLNWDNLIALCKNHHKIQHGKMPMRTDEYGVLIK